MVIELQCSHCGKQYKLKDALAGKRVKCGCGAAMNVPEDGSALLDLLESTADEPMPKSTAPSLPASSPQARKPVDPRIEKAKAPRTTVMDMQTGRTSELAVVALGLGIAAILVLGSSLTLLLPAFLAHIVFTSLYIGAAFGLARFAKPAIEIGMISAVVTISGLVFLVAIAGLAYFFPVSFVFVLLFISSVVLAGAAVMCSAICLRLVKTSEGKITGTAQAVGNIVVLAIVFAPIAIAILLTVEFQTDDGSLNGLRRIGLAMDGFHDVNDCFPARASHDKDGKPLLSWRVHLLPYLEGQELYDKFRLDEPWDSPHNRALIAAMPAVYDTGSGQGKTCFQVVVGDETMFPADAIPQGELDRLRGLGAIRKSSVVDPLALTVLVVWARTDRAVVWTAPDDVVFDKENPLAALGGLRSTTHTALMANAAVFEIRPLGLPAADQTWFTRDDTALGN